MSKAKTKSAKDNGFPLWFHTPTGQWCKKVKQKVYYFGPDKDEAAKRWHDEKDAIFAGRPRAPVSSDTAPVVELLNLFHAWQVRKMQNEGKPCQRHVDACKVTLTRFMDLVGSDCRLNTLEPNDWDRIRDELFKPSSNRKPANGGTMPRDVVRRSATTVDGDIRRITAFVNWAIEFKHLPATLSLGRFRPSSRQEQRKRRAKSGPRHLSRESILAILAKAKPSYKPMLLLALNGGMGSQDIADLTLSHVANIREREPWIDCPRGKTGGPRRFPLWKESRQAILDYLEIRPTPKKGVDPELLFLNSLGKPWVSTQAGGSHFDGIGTRFSELRKAAGLSRGTFYDCRRTFATVGSEVRDIEALRFLMGHIPPKNDVLADIYIQEISDDRVRLVVDHVRAWLQLEKMSVAPKL